MSSKQAGFSLVEVLIGGAVLAGIGLAAAYIFKQQRMAQNKIDLEQALTLTHQRVTRILQDVGHCNATFRSFYGANVGDISQVFQCTGATCGAEGDASTTTPAAWNPPLIEGGYVDSTTTNYWMIAPGGIVVNGNLPVASSGSTKVTITYQLNPRLGANRRVTKDVVVNLRLNNGRFRECYNNQENSLNNLQRDMCKALNFSGVNSSGFVVALWNDDTQTCTLPIMNKTCGWSTGIAGISATGTVVCRGLADGMNTMNIIHGGLNTVQNCGPGRTIQFRGQTVAGPNGTEMRVYMVCY